MVWGTSDLGWEFQGWRCKLQDLGWGVQDLGWGYQALGREFQDMGGVAILDLEWGVQDGMP